MGNFLSGSGGARLEGGHEEKSLAPQPPVGTPQFPQLIALHSTASVLRLWSAKPCTTHSLHTSKSVLEQTLMVGLRLDSPQSSLLPLEPQPLEVMSNKQAEMDADLR